MGKRFNLNFFSQYLRGLMTLSSTKLVCVDPMHGMRCHWHDARGNKCTRSTFGNRVPVLIQEVGMTRPICELFKLVTPNWRNTVMIDKDRV
jgi:hypothetical protein